MNTFERGETIICSIIITAEGIAVDPATSIKISITDPLFVKVVDDEAMVKDSTGHYHYDYTSAIDAAEKEYTVEYTAVDSARTTKQRDYFILKN